MIHLLCHLALWLAAPQGGDFEAQNCLPPHNLYEAKSLI